jgi:TRAP transporter 4TM/12TM fusion protein/TRAP transporter TAXI family solute receptor
MARTLEDRHPELESAEFEAEQPARDLSGVPKLVISTAAVAVSLYALYWVLRPQPAQPYRTSFLALTLAMTLLAYRPMTRPRARTAPDDGTRDEGEARDGDDNPGLLDWALAALALVALTYPLLVFDDFARRVVRPTDLDVLLGVVAVLLVLEATRRTVGWVLPAICLGFVAYALLGGLLPFGWELGHKGYDLERLVGQTYMGIEGIFGVPLDVAATYIVLFTIYGAVLEYSGAGRFFIDVSFAAFGTRSRAAPGRTATLAGFLLGTVSGSGVATTVTLGSVAWPVLRRAGYPPNPGGGVLAASGIGAILSPPTLGAAAFIIAEFLEISYLQVLLFATIPTLLYYLGVILAIEMDSRRYDTHGVDVDTPPLGQLLLRYGYYFSSLILIVVFMAFGLSPFRAVLYATLVALALGFLRRETRFTPRRLFDCLAAGSLGVLPVVAVCAAAGIIVAVVSLTGLGLKGSSLIVGAAGGSLVLAAIYSAVAVLVLGLAVPVTASFIISAVIVGPALIELGVGEEAAYMFIFYYAVLSEVSPPTALSSVAAAAITRGDAFKTMMLTLRYTLPAFLVPFAFVLSPNGEGLLLQGPILTVAWTLAVAAVAVAALAVATGGWLLGPARPPERVLAGLAALLLLYLEPLTIAAGAGLLVAAVAVHLALRRARPRGALTLLCVLVATLGLAGCGGQSGEGRRLSIATGGSGGVYFVYGGGLAEQIGEHLDGYQATAEVTSASVDNMYLIADGKSDLAFALADTAADAVKGTDTFDGERVQAQALARLYNNLTQVATVKDKGIGSIEDLRGKRVSVGSPGSGTEVIALRVLEAAGLDPDRDIERQRLGVGESVQAVKDGALDAFFWSGGVPTSAVTDLATSRELLLLPTDRYVEELKRRHGDFYAVAEIEPGAYDGVTEPVKVIAVPNYLVVNRSMDPELAYQLTRLLFERKEALSKVHPAAKRLELETAPEVAPLELHPGARRFYDEQART